MRRLVIALALAALACGGGSGSQTQAAYTVPNDPPAVDVSGPWTGIAVGASYGVALNFTQTGAEVSGDCRFRYHTDMPLPVARGRVGGTTLGAACAPAPWTMETCPAGAAFTIEGLVDGPGANFTARFTGVWRCGDATGQLVMYRDAQP